ncbi:DinB family protein [Massilia sp. BJB1822]|uniref:DinB family protein n=1 Tax=Massilia sp. BJB1822 TaxID=2744470 RepID=UPI0015949771|nr:DinB family protein [Massilia sp. BJB1822]NVD97556.1 DinB family protein [Massilia sp. BJB1822]
MTSQIQYQLQYKQWADKRTLDAVALIDSVQFPSEIAFARQQLNHMVRVEEVFRARLLEKPEPHATSNTEVVPELAELRERLSASNDWLLKYAESTPSEILAEKIHFRFLDGLDGTLSREEILFHMVNHGTYHRGAIGRALDLAGGLRPADTYTVFIHAMEPQRRLASNN